MNDRQNRTSLSTRQAFTLLELMLVLMLIVVAMSIAVPVLNKSLKTWRLKSAADVVLTECNRTRSRAIRNGEIYVFRFALQSGRYMTAPWLEGNELPDGFEVPQIENPIAAGGGEIDEAASEELQFATSYKLKELPEEVLFLGIQFQTKSTADNLPDSGLDYEVLSGGDAISNSVWSAPILFYPDGTSSPARIYLHNDRQQAIAITLRAMTGSGRVSEIETVNDFQNVPFAN
jgi:prepilin-type N-terminal cleavage/methylation domain-containing protein